MSTDEILSSEIKKWTKMAEEKMKTVSGDPKFLNNINAYIKDSKYFFEKNDLVRSFESIIWAWAWLEIGEDVGKIRGNAKKVS